MGKGERERQEKRGGGIGAWWCGVLSVCVCVGGCKKWPIQLESDIYYLVPSLMSLGKMYEM